MKQPILAFTPSPPKKSSFALVHGHLANVPASLLRNLALVSYEAMLCRPTEWSTPENFVMNVKRISEHQSR